MMPRSWEVTFVRVEDAFTLETAVLLKEQLSPVMSRPGHVVMDLRGASLDSTGLGAVLSMQHRLELSGRRLLVVSEDPQFLDLLDRAGVPDILSLFRDAEQAVHYVHKLQNEGSGFRVQGSGFGIQG